MYVLVSSIYHSAASHVRRHVGSQFWQFHSVCMCVRCVRASVCVRACVRQYVYVCAFVRTPNSLRQPCRFHSFFLLPVQAIDQLKRGSVPAEERVSPRALVDHIMARADNDHDNKLSKQEFISGALSSKTIQRMLVGTLAASSSPFAHRRKMAKQWCNTTEYGGYLYTKHFYE